MAQKPAGKSRNKALPPALAFLLILILAWPALAAEEALPVVPGPPPLPPGGYILGPLDFASAYAGYRYLKREKIDIHQYVIQTHQDLLDQARKRAKEKGFSGVCYFDVRFEFTDDMVVWYGRWTYYRQKEMDLLF